MEQADLDRIEGRKWAEEFLDCLKAESADYQLGVWRRLKRELPTQELDPKAMTDEQAREFGRQSVSFGRHFGRRYDDVPLDYWEWLADENAKVQRYLRSRRIMAERADEMEGE